MVRRKAKKGKEIVPACRDEGMEDKEWRISWTSEVAGDQLNTSEPFGMSHHVTFKPPSLSPLPPFPLFTTRKAHGFTSPTFIVYQPFGLLCSRLARTKLLFQLQCG